MQTSNSRSAVVRDFAKLFAHDLVRIAFLCSHHSHRIVIAARRLHVVVVGLDVGGYSTRRLRHEATRHRGFCSPRASVGFSGWPKPRGLQHCCDNSRRLVDLFGHRGHGRFETSLVQYDWPTRRSSSVATLDLFSRSTRCRLNSAAGSLVLYSSLSPTITSSMILLY